MRNTSVVSKETLELQSKDDDKFSSDTYSYLYEYWEQLPVIKLVSPETFQTMTEHVYRNAMNLVLRRGIPDKSGRKRHALSLKEMIKPMQKIIKSDSGLDDEIKLTALYHHRDKLIEGDIIKEVDTILEGKRYVTYYGRTAKAFIGDSYSHDQISEQVEILKQLILDHNPEIQSSNLDTLVEKLDKDMKSAKLASLNWVEKKVDLINKLDLDAIELFKIIYPFFAYDSKISKEIKDLIGIKSH